LTTALEDRQWFSLLKTNAQRKVNRQTRACSGATRFKGEFTLDNPMCCSILPGLDAGSIPHHTERNRLGWLMWLGYRWRSSIQLQAIGLMQLHFVDELRPTPYNYTRHHFPRLSWY
jgi:hypothetical protein